MKTLKITMYVLVLFALGACKKDDNEVKEPTPTNEEELITTVTLTFTKVGNTSNSFNASFIDIDGAGGNDATIDSIVLDANTTYEVSVELLDESQSDIEDITEEVKEEADEHLFCFEPTISSMNVEITDSDGTYLLGLESKWETTVIDSGDIKVSLKHQPNGQKDGFCSVGETDVEVIFPLKIK